MLFILSTLLDKDYTRISNIYIIYIYIYIYTNLPVNAIVRLHHSRRGGVDICKQYEKESRLEM